MVILLISLLHFHLLLHTKIVKTLGMPSCFLIKWTHKEIPDCKTTSLPILSLIVQQTQSIDLNGQTAWKSILGPKQEFLFILSTMVRNLITSYAAACSLNWLNILSIAVIHLLHQSMSRFYFGRCAKFANWWIYEIQDKCRE